MNKKLRNLLICLFFAFSLCLVGCGPLLPAAGTSAATPAASPAAITPQALSVDVTQVSGGLQIVQQTPLSGERLALQPLIQLVFDRDMDKTKTAAAWTFADSQGKPVKGAVSWKDARTFQFKPEAKLQPGAVYGGVFSTAAVGADGKSPDAAIKLAFHTVDALLVGQVFPADTAEDVEVGANITVIFNRPVVPINIVEEQNTLPQPLKIEPAVAGRGEWLNSSVYIFQPDKVLSSGTQYNVQVAAGLADVSGNTLASGYSWKFNTRAPQIDHFSLLNGEQDPKYEMGLVLLDQAFVVDFLQPMEPVSVAKALTLVNRENQKPFPTRLKWNKDFTQLTIEPVGRYGLANFYTLTLAAAAQAKSGGALKEGLTFKFSTVPFPAVESVYPKPGSKSSSFDSSMWIQFESPMKFASIKGKIKISPPLDKEPNLYYDEIQRQLHLDGLSAATDYVVRVLPGMADIYGNTIKTEYSFSFRTGNLSTSAQMLFPYTPLVYRKTGAQEFFFEYTNLTSATFSLYSVSFDEFTSRLTGEKSLVLPGSKPLREWQPTLQTVSNKTVRERIKLQDGQGNSLPPGYYYISLTSPALSANGPVYQGAQFVVATDNITFKTTGSEALAWVVDLEKGQPAANVPVVVYNDKYSEIGRAKTDEKGLVYLKGLTNPYIAQLDDPQHVAVASNDWGSGVSPSDFGIWQSYYGGKTNMPFAYVYTERPLYRPGQDVFFKGIVRQNDDLHYSLPTDSQVYVTIEQAGEKVYAEKLDLSKLGTFSGTFKLADNVTLGSYDIFVRYAVSDDPFATVSFRVAEYHKPEFQVNAATDIANVLAGDPLNFSLDATYYSGGGVGNAGVQWFTQATPYYFQPAAKYSGFNFMDWDRDVYWNPPASNGNGTLAEGQGVTDAKGHLDIKQVASLGESTVSQQVSFSANVTDVGGNLVSGSAGVVVHQTATYAGIRSKDYIGAAGKEQTFEMVALGWDSSPVPGQKLSVDFVERQWLSVQQQDAQGQLTWVTSVKEIPVKLNASVVTDKDGLATISFKPSKGGVYKATVTVRDAKGHTQHASAYIWVTSETYIPWRQTNDRSFSLIADKDSYAPGETANIMIAQPFQNDVYALVTFERGHIYQKEVVLLKGNSTIYQLPITKDMAPAAYVSVVVVSGAKDAKAPDFKIGMTRINVDTSQQSLDVSVTTDKRAAGPGDEVTYSVQTKDLKGNPVPAEVSLAVVDKAVLALAPSNSGPILASFYSDQGLGVMTSVGIVLNAEDFNANYHETVVDGQGTGGGGGKGEGDLGIITVRQDFKDTAFFGAQVMTDEKGQAQVKVKLPQNLTTWQVDVRAVTADSRVGQITGELMSTKPLFIEMQTPRFFTAGDAARVGAVLHNNSDAPLKVSASLEAQGVDLKSPAAQTVDVPARQQAYVTWDVVVRQGVRRVDLTASASSGAFTDSSKPALGTLSGQGLPVYSYNVPETVGTAGMLSDANSVTEAFQLPKTMGFGDTTLSVEVAPSLAASMKDGLTYLQDYSYLCIEQTISRFLPNVVSSHALKLAGAPAISPSTGSGQGLQSDLDAQVSTALQRLYAKQLSDGGWGWWDAQISDPQTSAYVMLGLQEAKEAGYAISDDVFTRGVDYLKNNLPVTETNGYAPEADANVSLRLGGGGGKPTPTPSSVLGSNDAPWKFNRQAFMLYVLARAGEKPSTGFLYDHRNSLSLYGEAYLAQAMYNGDPQDKRLPALMSDLSTAAVLSAAGAHWEEGYTDYWNWNTDVRTTAIVLDTFIKVDPKNPLTANAVRWLMAHRDGGHWASTQETAWTLMSLTHWLVASKEYDTNYQYALGLNGAKLKDGMATKDNLTETMKLEIGLKDLLADQANYLVLTRGAGAGNLYYSAYMTTSLPVENVQPLDQGVVISRQYFSLDDPKKPITQAARGDLVRVRLTMVIPDAVHYIVVNDPLPAGFEAVDAGIATDAQAPSSYTRQDFNLRGWGWWYFTHVEMRDEKVVLSTDYLPAGTYVYTYLARASTAGAFKVIPPNAAEFYFPDVGGRGAGSTFTVK